MATADEQFSEGVLFSLSFVRLSDNTSVVWTVDIVSSIFRRTFLMAAYWVWEVHLLWIATISFWFQNWQHASFVACKVSASCSQLTEPLINNSDKRNLPQVAPPTNMPRKVSLSPTCLNKPLEFFLQISNKKAQHVLESLPYVVCGHV